MPMPGRSLAGASAARCVQGAFSMLEQAAHHRRPGKGIELVHHREGGWQYLSTSYAERLAEAGIESSVGSVGDSDDTALDVT